MELDFAELCAGIMVTMAAVNMVMAYYHRAKAACRSCTGQ